MKWVIDASVVAKWFAPESDSAKAEELQDDELHAPDLLFAETANILWEKQVRREMNPLSSACTIRAIRADVLRVAGASDEGRGETQGGKQEQGAGSHGQFHTPRTPGPSREILPARNYR